MQQIEDVKSKTPCANKADMEQLERLIGLIGFQGELERYILNSLRAAEVGDIAVVVFLANELSRGSKITKKL